MKILIDVNLSPDWVEAFRHNGIDSVHWTSVGDSRAKDRQIMQWARSQGHVVFTHDLDFGALLALTRATGPSVLQIRTQEVTDMKLGTIIIGIVTGMVILIGTPALAVPADDVDAMVKELKDSDESVVEHAEQALITMGSVAVDAVVQVLKRNDPETQGAAIRILGKIGKPASRALMGALNHDHWKVRMGAARALGKIKDPAALEPLLGALRDEHQGVRATTASALGDFGNFNATQALIETLDDEVPVVRAAAARGLGKLGDARAVDPLLQMIQEPGRVRRAAVKALATIGVPAVDSMGKLLTDQRGDSGVRVGIAKAFKQMRATESVAPLITALHDTAHEVRKVAADALVAIGPPTVAPVREVLLHNPDPAVRVLAAEILLESSRQANRPWAQDALAALIVALKDDDPNVRTASKKGIERFHFQALKQLYVGLRENSPRFRIEIATTLADIGHPLSIRHLEELLTTETDPNVRKAAETAIDKIKQADILAPK